MIKKLWMLRIMNRLLLWILRLEDTSMLDEMEGLKQFDVPDHES